MRSRDPVEALLEADRRYSEAVAYMLEVQDRYARGLCSEADFHAERDAMLCREKERDALAAAMRDVLKAAAPFEEYEHCCEEPCPHLECRDIRALVTAFAALRKVVRDG